MCVLVLMAMHDMKAILLNIMYTEYNCRNLMRKAIINLENNSLLKSYLQLPKKIKTLFVYHKQFFRWTYSTVIFPRTMVVVQVYMNVAFTWSKPKKHKANTGDPCAYIHSYIGTEYSCWFYKCLLAAYISYICSYCFGSLICSPIGYL